MRIKDAKVYQADGTFATADIRIEGERINSAAKADGEIVDGFGLRAIPGLVDIRVYGAAGHDFGEADDYALDDICRYEAANGVLAVVPVIPVSPKAHAEKVIGAIEAWNGRHESREEKCAAICGVSLSRPLAGEQNAKKAESQIVTEDVQTTLDLIDKAHDLHPVVEVDATADGADELIAKVSKVAVVDIANENLDFARAEGALKAGATLCSHLWDEKATVQGKNPGVLGAAFDREGTKVELICDGLHVHDATVRATFALFQDRVAMVSSSLPETAVADGEYRYGDEVVKVKDGRAESADGVITGSTLNLFQCLQRAIDMGVPESVAINAATITPALAIGAEQDLGSLEDGRLANVVLVDDRWNIKHVINRGKLLF